MIEIIIKDYLSRALDCPVKLEKDGRPFGRSVFIEKTGGRGRFLRESTVAIQSYASSMYDAAALNEEVILAMQNLIEVDDVTRVELNSNYNYTDTTTKEYRYQAVFDITHY